MKVTGEVELSGRSCDFEDEGVTVRVDIFRQAGSLGFWALQVTSQDNDVTMWEELFPTEQEAWDEFVSTVERDGIAYFTSIEGGDTLH